MSYRSTLRALVITMLAACALALTARPAAAADHTIKLATLMPKGSPWGKVLEVWAKTVGEKSGGRLELQIFYNGVQGDEGAMVGKMKSGQLDGALVTAVGLSKIYKPILALQIPGLFPSWAKLDAAREGEKAGFEKGASDAGFRILGWADVGAAHLYSKGFAVRSPDSLKGKKPYAWRDDALQPIFYQVIGGVAPVPLNVPEVLPNLNTGAIDVVTAPALLAEQLQWTSKLDTVVGDVHAYWIGALTISSKKLDALPEDLRGILLDTAKVTAAALTKRIRDEDAAAFNRQKAKMTVITLTADERTAWDRLSEKLRKQLRDGTFSPELIRHLERYAQ